MDLEDLIEESDDGVSFYVHVQPAAGRTRVLGTHGNAVKVSVAAPPTGGRANDAVLHYLSKTLGVEPWAIRIVSGQTQRKKRVAVKGVGRSMAAKLLAAQAPVPRATKR